MKFLTESMTGPHSAVGNLSDGRSRGREFDPGLDLSFHGD